MSITGRENEGVGKETMHSSRLSVCAWQSMRKWGYWLSFHSIHHWRCGDNWVLKFLSLNIMHVNFWRFIVYLRFCGIIYRNFRTIWSLKGMKSLKIGVVCWMEYIRVSMQMLKWQVERGELLCLFIVPEMTTLG